ncbi:MAG: hypothetical protein AB7O30_10825 [Dehalococcoidia bacterium]
MRFAVTIVADRTIAEAAIDLLSQVPSGETGEAPNGENPSSTARDPAQTTGPASQPACPTFSRSISIRQMKLYPLPLKPITQLTGEPGDLKIYRYGWEVREVCIPDWPLVVMNSRENL